MATAISGTSGNDAIQAHPTTSGVGSLVLVVSGTPGEGTMPVFNVLINGSVVLANVQVTAVYGTGATQQVSVALPTGVDVDSVGIQYANDAQASYSMGDRNLHVSSVKLNGTVLPMSTGTYFRDVMPTIPGQQDINWGGTLEFSDALVQSATGSGGVAGEADINAGAGLDLVVYHGLASSYSIAATTGGYTVTTGLNTDTLVSVERLQFDDMRVALDVTGNGGMAYRLYQAAFNRAPDMAGLGFQMKTLDDGWDISSVSQNFIDSPEFSATYGSLNNSQFVTQLYQNVLHRAPDDAGLAYHTGNLDSGALVRSNVLAQFSESPENQAALIGTIQNGMAYTL